MSLPNQLHADLDPIVAISALRAELLAARADIARLEAENAFLRHNQLVRATAATANGGADACTTSTSRVQLPAESTRVSTGGGCGGGEEGTGPTMSEEISTSNNDCSTPRPTEVAAAAAAAIAAVDEQQETRPKKKGGSDLNDNKSASDAAAPTFAERRQSSPSHIEAAHAVLSLRSRKEGDTRSTSTTTATTSSNIRISDQEDDSDRLARSRSPEKRPIESQTRESNDHGPSETNEASSGSGALWFTKRSIVKPKRLRVEEKEGRGAGYTYIFVQQTLLDLLRKVRRKVDAYGYFSRPVDPVRDECPDYYDIIDRETEAMDLDTVENMIECGSISSVDEFESMLERIAHCCRKYNTDPSNGVRQEGDRIMSLSKPLLENARSVTAKRFEGNADGTEKKVSSVASSSHGPGPAKRGKATDRKEVEGVEEEFPNGVVVYVEYKDVLYCATVLDKRIRKGGPEYFIHYYGYKETADQWVKYADIHKKTAYTSRRYNKQREEEATAGTSRGGGTTSKKLQPGSNGGASKGDGKSPERPSYPGELFDRRAPEIGAGWRVKAVKRKCGDRVDRYWLSPKKQKKLRSKREIERFLDALNKVEGNEEKAFAMIKGK